MEAAGLQEAFLAGFDASENQFKEASAYTYEQMATLNLQLQGLIDENNEAFFRLREECEYYKKKLSLIGNILNNA